MKFVYAYKTKDNVRHTDVVCASGKEAAYEKLRACGIKPIRVDLAPGLANKLLSFGKRGLALALLSVVSVVLMGLLAYNFANGGRSSPRGPMTRRQIYGDPALMEELERTDYKSVFSTDADCYLAHFAQPGVIVQFADPVWRKSMAAALSAGFTNEISVVETDDREVRELKQIVLGLRAEYKRYMSNGLGTPEKYIRRLEERQNRELAILTAAKGDLKDEKDPMKWDRINRSLKAVGLPTLVMQSDE